MKILKVQFVRLLFIIFFVKKFKIFEKIRDFLKKCQKLNNCYFLAPKSANIDQKLIKMVVFHI